MDVEKYDFGCHLFLQKDQNDSFRISPKKTRQKKKQRETLILCNLCCINVSIINSNPTRSHRSTPKTSKKHHQPSTFATATHDFFPQKFEVVENRPMVQGFFVCVEPRLLPFILLGFCLKGYGNMWIYRQTDSQTHCGDPTLPVLPRKGRADPPHPDQTSWGMQSTVLIANKTNQICKLHVCFKYPSDNVYIYIYIVYDTYVPHCELHTT